MATAQKQALNPVASNAFMSMQADGAKEFESMPEFAGHLSELRKVQSDHTGKLEDFGIKVVTDERMKWHLEGSVKKQAMNRLLFREHAYSQFCSHLGFPGQTLAKCPSTLAAENVAYFGMMNGSQDVTVRVEGDQFRAFLSGAYKKVDHIEIVRKFLESHFRYEVNYAGLTAKRMFILAVEPDSKWKGPDGSEMSHCTLVGNSETGEGSFFAQDLWYDHI